MSGNKIKPVIVDGIGDSFRALKVLKHTINLMEKIPSINLQNPILYTTNDIKSTNINIVKIDKLNYMDYNRTILTLNDTLDDDDSHILICQTDGFPINAAAWTDEFFEYDYIGAPWLDNYINRVGNGGFSMRSKKFLQASNEIFKNETIEENEDLLCCVFKYQDFINKGIKFAPVNLALKFSIEHFVPELREMNSFGFHGKFTKMGSNAIEDINSFSL